MSPKLCIVVAVSENGVIGKENGLPWRLPEDLKYFKRTTMGHPIIMGRKTYDSIGSPLPGRTNIVVTRQPDWQAEGVLVVHSLDEAMSVASSADDPHRDEVMLIGGAQLYAQAMSKCSKLFLTEVHADIEGDAYFPAWERDNWREKSRVKYLADGNNPYSYSFVVFDRLVE